MYKYIRNYFAKNYFDYIADDPVLEKLFVHLLDYLKLKESQEKELQNEG